jgi:hypothetical protein
MQIFGAVLMVLGPVLAAVLAVAVPVLLGVMVYDAVTSRRNARPNELSEESAIHAWTEATARRIQLERGIARAFVILGGVFWGIAAFAGLFSFQETGARAALMAAAVPLGAALVTLVIGWYWERVAAALLVAASATVVYWGVVTQFELGVWILLTIFLIGPMLTAAVLFWLARQEYIALELHLARPELAMATVKRF